MNFLRTAAFLLSIFACSFNLSAQTAQNINFTDLDGTTHDLYSYLDSGYIVILDFSYQYCGPCYDWSINVGHDLWETYGPNGQNILRMFYFDVDIVFPIAPDEDVAAYTEEWGIEYPVINNDGKNVFSEYPEDSYPQIYFICSDKTFTTLGGYSYPGSQAETFITLYQDCFGYDLDSNYTMFAATVPTTNTICDNSPMSFTPQLTILQSSVFTLDSNNVIGDLSMDSFDIKIYVNGEYLETQTIDSSLFGSITLQYTPTLDSLPVNPGDTLTFIGVFNGDAFALDDTLTVVIPSQINTPTSTDSSLYLEALGPNLYYNLFGADGQLIESGSGSSQFELSPDSCYSLSFSNSHVDGMVLKDANEQEVFSFEAGQYEGYSTPKLYFHVSNNTVDIEDLNFLDKKILEHYFIDMLGKRHKLNELEYLPKGVFIEVKLFEDGSLSSNKIYNNKLF